MQLAFPLSRAKAGRLVIHSASAGTNAATYHHSPPLTEHKQYPNSEAFSRAACILRNTAAGPASALKLEDLWNGFRMPAPHLQGMFVAQAPDFALFGLT